MSSTAPTSTRDIIEEAKQADEFSEKEASVFVEIWDSVKVYLYIHYKYHFLFINLFIYYIILLRNLDKMILLKEKMQFVKD